MNVRGGNGERGPFRWLMGEASRDHPWNILVLVLGVALAGGFAWMFFFESHRPLYLANALVWILFAARSVWVLISTHERE